MSEPPTASLVTIPDEAIAERAYQIWESKGCPDGDGSENWEAAKAELLAQAEQTPSTESRRGPLLRLFDRIRNRAAL
ncbi:MAG: DUF2934 domain-containing protein [Planctomycetota bacterium]